MFSIGCIGKGSGTPLPSRLICRSSNAGFKSIPPTSFCPLSPVPCPLFFTGEEAGFSFAAMGLYVTSDITLHDDPDTETANVPSGPFDGVYHPSEKVMARLLA